MELAMFEPQLEMLQSEFRCIAYDERGHGKTKEDGKPFDLWDLADDAVGLLDHLRIEKAIFVGMSQGGFLTLRAALRYPERVHAMVLIDTRPEPEPEDTLAQFMPVMQDWAKTGPKNNGEMIADVLGVGDPKLRDIWMQKWYESTPYERLLPATQAVLVRDDLTPRLAEITCPAIVFHGTEDQAIPIVRGRFLAENLSGCERIVEVEGAGHAPNLSHPQVVNPPMLDFIGRHASTSA
jgi:pimeloyl-ACP methyl ester carboxylesterase